MTERQIAERCQALDKEISNFFIQRFLANIELILANIQLNNLDAVWQNCSKLQQNQDFKSALVARSKQLLSICHNIDELEILLQQSQSVELKFLIKERLGPLIFQKFKITFSKKIKAS